MICAFTGHRPRGFDFGYDESAPECQRLKVRIRGEIEKLVESGVAAFISGMALGADTWCAEAVIALKGKYPFLRLIAAIPCPDQADRWPEADRKRYAGLLDACDEKYIVSPRYTSYCMMARNRFMVEKSDMILAVWNGRPGGGTAATVALAERLKKPITIIKV